MANLADSLIATTSRPMSIRMRPELASESHRYQGRRYWVIKDPVSLKYYRFEEEEYAILSSLDGKTSADEVIGRFNRRFAPQKLTVRELHQFITSLFRSSLVVSAARGQGKQLAERHLENRTRERWGNLTNILAIRFRGFDPDWLLTWLNNWFGWVFSLPAVAFCVAMGFVALMIVSVEFETFQAKLPTFQQFFAAENWFWLALTLGLTKVAHEFGHGLACKRFGGECNEMGLMLLVLTPCLYCNVSDSWMLSSKYRRAAIGAAGMYVELILATIATFFWWFSQPGMLNYLCLNVMFVCSVSTLLFNINPLLRYDGYYILSDLMEIPNLRQKASSILSRKLGAVVLGLPESPDPFLPQRGQLFFAAYSVAAGIYRWVVACSIFWVLYHVCEPYGMKIIGQMIAASALVSLVVMPVWQGIQFFYVPGRIEKVSKMRVALTLCLLCAAVVGVMYIPLPHYVWCTVEVQPRDAATVYIDAPGSLQVVHVKPGEWVSESQQLMLLDNPSNRLAMEDLYGQRKTLVTRLANLRRQQYADYRAGEEISQVEQTIVSIDEQIINYQNNLKRLTITAPMAGQVFAVPPRRDDAKENGMLASWTGQPLDPKNVGAVMEDGAPICRIGDPAKLEAILAIDQSDIEFVAANKQVDIFLEHLPGRRFTSTLDRISQANMKAAPKNMSLKGGGSLETRTDSHGYEAPISTTYQAKAKLDDARGELFIGATGHARVYAGQKTVGARLIRYLCQTFSFEM